MELDRLHQVSQNLKVRLIDHVARNQVRFRQFVGLIRLGDRDIELLPKIESVDANEPPAGIRMNLLQMLIVATDTKVQFFGNAGAALARANWLDVFIQLFCRELLDQLRRGMIRCYRDEEDDLSVVRGRILMDQQLTRNFVHRERVACEFDEQTTRNALTVDQVGHPATKVRLFGAARPNRMTIAMNQSNDGFRSSGLPNAS